MQTDSIEVRCRHCSSWFESPVRFRSIEAFLDGLDAVRNAGGTVQCAHCRHLTPFTDTNIRIPGGVEDIRDTVRVA